MAVMLIVPFLTVVYVIRLQIVWNHLTRPLRSSRTGEIGVEVNSKIFQAFFPVVLWLHSHLSLCLHLIATVVHLSLLTLVNWLCQSYERTSFHLD